MSCILLSQDANPILNNFLKTNGNLLIEIKKTELVYDAVSSHADIYVCKVGQSIIIEQSQLEIIKNQLDKYGINYRCGQNTFGYKYPKNILFNAYCTDKYIIHKLAYTDNIILDTAKQQGLIPINVSQGYTKCNIVQINNNTLITSDIGIEQTLKKYNFDVLLISQGHIVLNGFKYGFLGGASGKIGNKIIFNGNILDHPDCKQIISFIQNKGLEVVYFKEYPLTDIGSIIEL